VIAPFTWCQRSWRRSKERNDPLNIADSHADSWIGTDPELLELRGGRLVIKDSERLRRHGLHMEPRPDFSSSSVPEKPRSGINEFSGKATRVKKSRNFVKGVMLPPKGIGASCGCSSGGKQTTRLDRRRTNRGPRPLEWSRALVGDEIEHSSVPIRVTVNETGHVCAREGAGRQDASTRVFVLDGVVRSRTLGCSRSELMPVRDHSSGRSTYGIDAASKPKMRGRAAPWQIGSGEAASSLAGSGSSRHRARPTKLGAKDLVGLVRSSQIRTQPNVRAISEVSVNVQDG